ncbi:hypothetical protein B0H12DRAFT_197484 [Mycena haematopus]|nr:hypothetical protein B0H12DRAFT_197484 [Mycena haematopus]
MMMSASSRLVVAGQLHFTMTFIFVPVKSFEITLARVTQVPRPVVPWAWEIVSSSFSDRPSFNLMMEPSKGFSSTPCGRTAVACDGVEHGDEPCGVRYKVKQLRSDDYRAVVVQQLDEIVRDMKANNVTAEATIRKSLEGIASALSRRIFGLALPLDRFFDVLPAPPALSADVAGLGLRFRSWETTGPGLFACGGTFGRGICLELRDIMGAVRLTLENWG